MQYDHVVPLELGGRHHADNIKPAHQACHVEKTVTKDMPAIRKAKRLREKGSKTKRKIPSRGFPKRQF